MVGKLGHPARGHLLAGLNPDRNPETRKQNISGYLSNGRRWGWSPCDGFHWYIRRKGKCCEKRRPAHELSADGRSLLQ